MDDKNWEEAVNLRGRSFKRHLETYKLLTKMQPPVEKGNLSGGKGFTLAMMNVGAPACGMNAAVRSFVRTGIYHQCKVYGIYDAFEGLLEGDFEVTCGNFLLDEQIEFFCKFRNWTGRQCQVGL